MEERRKHKRLDLEVMVELERLDEESVTTLKYVHVEVTDISRSGLGFKSKADLEIGSYYDTRIQIWTKEVVDAVIEIVRRDALPEGGYKYGCRFIGMPDTDALKIDIYQIFNDLLKNRGSDTTMQEYIAMSFQKIKSSTSRCFDISTAALHIIAMLFMLMDHLWATLLPAQEWLTCVGRIAFPIFAFMSVEGYFHTHNFKKYLLRMLVFAVISEIPFDLMYGGTWFYPVHQNVIWTFILGLLGIHIMETVRKKKKTPVFVLTAILVTIAGGLLGTLTMVDYYGIGVLTVFIFYFFRGRKWWCLLGQIAALYWVNVELLGGLMYPVRLFGMEFELCQQGLALLALVPIWLYRGRQGYHSKPFQYFCYAFYPVHMLILVLILGFVNR